MSADLSAAAGASPSKKKLTAIGATLTKISPEPTLSEIPEVKFSINPERISVSHTFKTEGASGNNFEDQIKSLGFIEISVDKVLLLGAGIQKTCETLITWSCPAPTEVGAPKKQKVAKDRK